MAFVDQFNISMQRVMSMRTPEIMALLPRVEEMTYDSRVKMVERGRDNLAAVLKSWDKFAPMLIVQGLDRAEVKRRLKGLRAAKKHLSDGIRLTDPRLPPAFASQAEAAFNVLAACFLRDAGVLDGILTGPRIGASSISTIELPCFDAAVAASRDLVREEAYEPAGSVRTEPEGEVVDVITASGGDRMG